MKIHCHVDFTGLLPTDIQQDCEREFLMQMHQTDGELFTWSKTHFSTINLNAPGPISQAVLQYFADCGCPICGIMLGISLYPITSEIWPIRSPSMSYKYLFNSIETILNIRTDNRIRGIIHQFEQSLTFKQAMHVASIFINDHSVVTNFCPEVIMYVRKQHAEPTILQ
ncbi:hypothetical protein [Shewanella baltica]|uniref:hypothetical protein n=1 Tax=Shewanella baltica TaxID=62322 RepID=UPI002221F3B9|nr:hypothetical protein [Shewanella baltica]